MTPLVDDVRTEGDHTDQRTRFGPWQGPQFTGLVAVTAVIAVAAVIGLSIAGGNPFIGGLPPTATPNPLAASASVTDGDFRLTITSPKATWGTDEAIEVGTTLEYLGPEAKATLWGSLSGLIRFGVVEVSGDRIMGGEFAASVGPPGQRDCGPHVISAAANITAPFSKGGVYDANDPHIDFYDEYLADPQLYLPPGQWEIITRATFDAGDEEGAVGSDPAEDPCTPTATQMSVSITLTVEGSGEPSPEPSPAEPSAEGELGKDPLSLPPDILAVGAEVTPLAPKGMLPREQALVVAQREFPFIQGAQIDAYLVELTDPHQLGGVGAVDRPIWIIRASGGAWDIFSVPITPDGTAPDVGLASLGYIYVDAITGEWLQALFE